MPAIDATLDAFARRRMSQPLTLFDSKLTDDNRPDFWDDQEVSGGGTGSTHSVNTASVVLDVSATTAGRRVRQTKRRFNYQPGKGQLVIFTGNPQVPYDGDDPQFESGIIKRTGYYDDDNGIFLEINGTATAGDEVALVIRSNVTGSPVDTRILQRDWNIDTLQPTGTSGNTLRLDKSLIFIIDFEWLGVGQVRAGVFFEGVPIYFHAETHVSTLESVYMSTPNLPCRYEIINDGTGVAASIRQVCTTVISEGGQELTGKVEMVSRGTTTFETAANNLIQPLIAMRLKQAYLGVTVDVLTAQVYNLSAPADYEVLVIFNPTVAGDTTAADAGWVNATNSAVQYNFSYTNTNTLTGGILLDGAFSSASNQIQITSNVDIVNALRMGAKIDGTADIVFIAVRNLDTTPAAETFTAHLRWRELL